MDNTAVVKAIAKLYERLFDGCVETLIEDVNTGRLTKDTARNGREVLWYMDETRNEAVYIDTLEFLTEEEIEKELHHWVMQKGKQI